jgi:transcriptional regulator with XRE-family HTH domain
MNLKQWRERAGRSQLEVANELNCTQANVSRIESGQQDATARQIRVLVELSGGAITAADMVASIVGDSL